MYGDTIEAVDPAIEREATAADITGLLDSGIVAAKPKVRLTEDELFALKIQRRRQQDSERRSRLQHAKNAISCDKDMLDHQAAEHRAKKDEERQFMISGDIGLLGSQHQAQKEVKTTREQTQRAVRDFNLGVSATKKADATAEKFARLHDAPPRDGDLDPRCGVASMQKFAGEDLMRDERLRQQRLMQVDCIEQQKFEKAMLKRAEEEENKKYEQEVADVIRTRNEIEAENISLRKEMNKSYLQGHVALKQEKDAAKQRRREEESALNEAEIKFVNEDEFTAETGQQFLDNGRVRRDRYKGASRDAKLAIQEEVLKQAAEKEMVRHMLKEELRENGNEGRKVQGLLDGMERQKQRSRRAMAAQCCADNLRMQEEAKLRKKEINELYRNEVNPSFYEQFGKDAR